MAAGGCLYRYSTVHVFCKERRTSLPFTSTGVQGRSYGEEEKRFLKSWRAWERAEAIAIARLRLRDCDCAIAIAIATAIAIVKAKAKTDINNK